MSNLVSESDESYETIGVDDSYVGESGQANLTVPVVALVALGVASLALRKIRSVVPTEVSSDEPVIPSAASVDFAISVENVSSLEERILRLKERVDFVISLGSEEDFGIECAKLQSAFNSLNSWFKLLKPEQFDDNDAKVWTLLRSQVEDFESRLPTDQDLVEALDDRFQALKYFRDLVQDKPEEVDDFVYAFSDYSAYLVRLPIDEEHLRLHADCLTHLEEMAAKLPIRHLRLEEQISAEGSLPQ